MKAFIIVVCFFLAFIVFASSSLGNVNLTSNTPGVVQAAAAPTSTQPLVITIQESPAITNSNAAFVPVTGGCANPYTIQPGDWLLKIAANCNTTLALILRSNSQITNPNLIYPDQLITMPNGAFIPVTGPVTGGCTNSYTIQPGDWLSKIAAKCDTTLAAILQANPQIIDANLIYPDQQIIIPNASATAPIPLTGLIATIQSGTDLQVRAINFPPDTLVNVAIGPKSAGNTVVASDVTDANGNLTTHITVPNAPDSQTPWVVDVATTSNPPTQAMSQPFHIK